MKTLLNMIFLPAGTEERYGRAHQIWLAVTLTGLGCCIGLLSLVFSAVAVDSLSSRNLLLSYVTDPLILFLNLWPPVLLVWLFYFLFRRAWIGFLGGFLPIIGVALVNYYKIQLRADPFLAVDLNLASEAAGIVGKYELELNWLIWLTLAALLAGLVFAVLLMPRGLRGWQGRMLGALSAGALLAVSFVSIYLNDYYYEKTGGAMPWNEAQDYVSKGGIYPFLHSFQEMIFTAPEGYEQQKAEDLLNSYQDADIAEDQKVSVMGIMLEAFCDLTDFEILAQQDSVMDVYAPWHALEEQSVSGRLLTNIFAGGTVDTEWAFLTGYSNHSDFIQDTDSYVWYLDGQGYQTFGSHPGFGWFYDRQSINEFLGFQEYWFTENHYGDLVDPVAAQWNSDHVLMEELLKQLSERVQDGPCFSFSVSYQNHGPYEWQYTIADEYLTPESTGLTQESCNIWNNYLMRVADTLSAINDLVAGVEEMEEPVVLVLFGDHKPWGGNGNSGYSDLGCTFDLLTAQGFYDYYATPYIIWANSSAKEVLNREFTGEGGDFSPCFLMTEIFDQCGWEGPGFMQLAREIRQVTPLIHELGIYWKDGAPCYELPEEEQKLIDTYQEAEYYREHFVEPGAAVE